jgi:hypothetical protein
MQPGQISIHRFLRSRLSPMEPRPQGAVDLSNLTRVLLLNKVPRVASRLPLTPCA